MKRIIVAAAAAALICLAQSVYEASAMAPDQEERVVSDPGQKGPYEIGFTSFVLTDPSRPGDGAAIEHRPIPVFVWYPVDPGTIGPSSPEAIYPLDPVTAIAPDSTSSDWEKYGMDRAYQEPTPSANGPFPLLMFSPGLGVEPWHHTSIGTRLASHGFVVAILYHYADGWWWPFEPTDQVAVAAFNRPRDVSFALTELLKRNATSGDLLHGSIRPEQIAAGGWSLGGYAAMVLAGGDDSVCDMIPPYPGPEDNPPWTCAASLPDPRIKAILPLDGSTQALHFYELARVSVPVIGIGEEWNSLEQNLGPGMGSWQARAHAAYSGHPAYRVDVFNTNHPSFSDLCEGFEVMGDKGILTADWVAILVRDICGHVTSPAVIHPLVTKYMIAFLKTHLADEPGYQEILTPGWALTREPLIEFFETERKNSHSINEDWPDLFIYFPHQPGSEQAASEKDPKTMLPIYRAGMSR